MSDDTTMKKGPASARGPERSLVLYHRDGTKVAPLGATGTTIVVGRAWPSDVVLEDPSLSRRHAQFTVREHDVIVEDLESTNGTWSAGKRIERAEIKAGDEVRLGDVTACVHMLASRSGAPGLESHERFVTRLEDEVVRARTFARPLAVLMIRADDGPRAHVRHWTERLLSLLRPVDHAALYADDTALVLLPEASGAGVAQSIVRSIEHVRAGVAIFPQDGTGPEELLSAVRRSLASATGAVRVGHAGIAAPPSALVAIDPRMRAVVEDATRVAASQLPILVLGETGTGKEVLARLVHAASARRDKPLHCINCAAIPEALLEATLFGHEKGAFTGADRQAKGVFEQAHKGTVLLDEVGELSPSAQAALLRVLEAKRLRRVGGEGEIEVDVRVIAATHRDLESMVADGSFRRDLLYRLDAMTLVLPPLRERREEIRPLALAFVESAGRRLEISSDAWHALERYAWPGNVRELKNAIERAAALAKGNAITAADLPERVRTVARPTEPPLEGDFKTRVRDQMQRYETELILDALRRSNGNQAQAARMLGMPIRTFTHKMQALGIKKRYE